MSMLLFFFFKQKTGYEMRMSDWSSDVCSSDLFAEADLMCDVRQRGRSQLIALGVVVDEEHQPTQHDAIDRRLGVCLRGVAQKLQEAGDDLAVEMGRAS